MATEALRAKKDAITRLVKPETMKMLEDAHNQFFDVLSDRSLTEAERIVATALAVSGVRKALDGPILDHVIMPLMNSPVGFDTDRNPAKGYDGAPYDRSIVLECSSHAWVSGLPMVGNCWNIIGKNMYPRKEGYARKLSTLCRYSYAAAVPPIPQEIYNNGGYIVVPVEIEYQMHGSDEKESFSSKYKVRMTRRNPVGVEYAEGKALRKAYRDLIDVITGVSLPESIEVEETGRVHQVGGTSRQESQAPVAVVEGEILNTGQITEINRRTAMLTDEQFEDTMASVVGEAWTGKLEDVPAELYQAILEAVSTESK